MKKEINPVTLIGIIVVVVIALGIFGYRALQPAPYMPSPGSPGATSNVSGAATHPGQPASGGANDSAGASTYYPSAPAGSTPGKPVGPGH